MSRYPARPYPIGEAADFVRECGFYSDRLEGREQVDPASLAQHRRKVERRRFSEAVFIEERFQEFIGHSGNRWTDLSSLLQRFTIVWLSRHAFVVRYDEAGNVASLASAIGFTELASFDKYDDAGGWTFEVTVCVDPEAEQVAAVNKMFDLVAQTRSSSVSMRQLLAEAVCPLTPRTLTNFTDTNQSHGQILFRSVSFSQEHGRELGSHPGRLVFSHCVFTDRGEAMFEQVRQSQGPHGLVFYTTPVDMPMLQGALSEGRRLQKLTLSDVFVDFLSLGQALERNHGLIEFELGLPAGQSFPWDEWSGLLHSVRNHPTLAKLSFPDARFPLLGFFVLPVHPLNLRICRPIADLLRTNTVLGELNISPVYHHQPTWDREIQPRLLLNRFRKRVRLLIDEENQNVRTGIFGMSLLHRHARQNPSIMLYIISHFPEILSQLYIKEEESDDDSESSEETSDVDTRPRKRRRTSSDSSDSESCVVS